MMTKKSTVKEYVSPMDVAYLMRKSHTSFLESYQFVIIENSYLTGYDFKNKKVDNEEWLTEEAEYISKATGYPLQRVKFLRDSLYTRVQTNPYGSKGEKFDMLWNMLAEIKEKNLQNNYQKFYENAKMSFSQSFLEYMKEKELDDSSLLMEVRNKYLSI